MAKAKSKSKFDFKQFLLKKGEYLAMGIAGLFLVILTLWGITKWSSAKDPDKISKDLTQKSQAVQSKATSPEVTEQDKEQAALPAWVTAKYEFKQTPPLAFLLTNPQFDPTAKPDTKKENPHVYPIGAYQIDLTRGSMKGFDIIDGKDEQMIAVIFDKRVDPQDKERLDLLLSKKKRKGSNTQPKNPMGGGMGQPPGGGLGQPPGGGLGQPPGGGLGQPPAGGGSGRGRFNPYGEMGGSFNTGAQRVEKSIEYVSITQLDEAIKKQKIPAMTVIPLRMITIHAEIPLKKQIDEIKRALRLPDAAEAAKWGPYYDGYNVKRKVSRVASDGTVELQQDWADYNFEERYRELINARKSADHFDDGYLAHFVRYEMSLALPLPELVSECSDKYPDIRLKNIEETIKKLKNADKKPVDPSEISKRVGRGTPRGDLYRPQRPDETGGSAFWGGEAGGMHGPGMNDKMMLPPPPTGGLGSMGVRGSPVDPNNPNNPNLNSPVEIEHLLLRFVDVDVEPGLTYEYQIQLRIKNPNYKRTKEVSKPSDAEKEFLDSPWVQLPDAITVPSETYLFASDWAAYHKRTKEEHEKEQILLNRLQVKDHQAVVETCSWMQEVKTGDGGKREPIGAWVVADYPVGRGEFIGRKQYVKLPLWSSETKSYVLREVPDKVIPKVGTAKEPPQPRGWLLDFTSNTSILVDFEGGKVRTRVGSREVIEEVSTELLVLRGDGKLVVKNSVRDDTDKFRKEIVDTWEKWVKDVSTRKVTSEEGGGFTPRPPGGGSSP